MNVSEKGFAFVAAREAGVLTAYRDGKRLAIGFGENDPKLRPGDTITLDEAIKRYVKRSAEFVSGVKRIFDGVELEQNHLDALFSLAWNFGVTGLKRQKKVIDAVWAYYDDGEDDSLALVGKAIAALPHNNSRRKLESKIFTDADYGDLSTLAFWPSGKDPRKTRPSKIAMPKFLRR